MSTFTRLLSNKVVFESDDGIKTSLISTLSVVPHPASTGLIILTPFASGQEKNADGFIFDWTKVTIPAGATTRNELIILLSTSYFITPGFGDIQNPIAVDGDTVYCKDIDSSRSVITGFTGEVCDPFNDLHSENVDNSATNPKTFLIHFNRTIITNIVGIGSSEGGSFSNVKIIGILSGGIETVLADFSADNTVRLTQVFVFPNAGVNAIRLEFHTVNTISITNIFIPKIQVVASISETPIVYATSYNPPYLLNGSSQDMNVAGSIGTPIDFEYEITGFALARWTRSFIDLQDGNQDFLPENFGAIVGALPNGVQIIVVKDSIETVLETWKTNMDISMTMFDFNSPYRTGSYIGRWTLPSDLGSPITLFPGDKIICRIQDDLTPTDAFRIRTKLKQ